MSWMEVIQGLKQGKKFKRPNKLSILSAENGMIFSFYSPNGVGIRWMPFIDDYEATDWEEYQE